jgi:MtaA/CmuA family methyltransferase
MTSLERVAAVLDHQVPDRVPVALHNFLMASAMTGAGFDEVFRNGEALAEAELRAWHDFGHDVIMHENGVCGEAEALGCGIAYHPDIPPHVADPVIKSFDDVDKLTVPDPEKTFPLNELLKATRILVRETKGQAFVMGRADQGPMALAAALCGPEKFLLAVMDPDLRPKVLQLCDICSRMNIAFGAAQQRAGAHGTSLGVYGSSMISPRLFCDLELPRVQRFCLEMCKLGLRTFVHSCGNETRLLDSLVQTGASCLELDPRTDPGACKRAIHGRVGVLGMLEPAHVLGEGTIEQVRAHALEIMRIMAPGGDFIMGPGCALPGNTPRENIHAVMECARTAGVYAPDGSLPNLPSA